MDMVRTTFLHNRFHFLKPAKRNGKKSIKKSSTSTTRPLVFFIAAAIAIIAIGAIVRILPSSTLAVSPAVRATDAKEYAQIMSTFSAQGLSPRLVHPISKPFFSAPGELIAAGGDTVQAFAYPDAAAAARESSGVSVDGYTYVGKKIQWQAQPHFFRKDNVIVFYLGSNADVLRSLEESLGPQFAGAKIPSNTAGVTLK